MYLFPLIQFKQRRKIGKVRRLSPRGGEFSWYTERGVEITEDSYSGGAERRKEYPHQQTCCASGKLDQSFSSFSTNSDSYRIHPLQVLIAQFPWNQVCASSAKKHTTRVAYRAILHWDNTELVFVDTPGVVSNQDVKKHSLEDSFRVDPQASLKRADVIGVLHDVSKVSTRDQIHPEILNLLQRAGPQVPSLLLLNKVDQIKTKRKLLDFVNKLSGTKQWPHFVDVFMLSALNGDGVQDLRVSGNLSLSGL